MRQHAWEATICLNSTCLTSGSGCSGQFSMLTSLHSNVKSWTTQSLNVHDAELPPDNLLVRNFMNNFCDTFCWWWIAWHKFYLNIISTCEHLQMFVRFRSNIGKVFFSFFDNFHYQFFCFSIVSSIVGTFPICLVKLYENASLSRWLKTFWENRIFARGVQICEFKITLLLMGSSPSCVALPVRWRLFVKTLQRPLCVSSYYRKINRWNVGSKNAFASTLFMINVD